MRLGALFVLGACGTTSAATVLPGPASHVVAAPEEHAEAAPIATPAPSAPPSRIRYDLARSVERASSFVGDAELIAFGHPSGAQATLGGWSTGWEAHAVDGVRMLVHRRSSARFFVFSPRAAATMPLVLSGRAFGGGEISVYANGTLVGSGALEGPLRLDVPAELVRLGDNEIQLRARGGARLEGFGAAAIGLEWASVGGVATLVAESPQPPQLQLLQGRSLRYGLVVPEGARLTANVSGQVSVGAMLDDGSVVSLGSAGPGRADIALETIEGQPVWLMLEAVEDATLESPSIVSPHEPSAPLGRPRHVVMFLIDTLRADKLAPYNPETRVRTPGLSSFVERAVTFSHAHSQENWTKPSVATLLSSLMPWEHTATTHESIVPTTVQMLPEVLKERGFFTGAFIANGYVSDRFGFDQGWSTYRNYIREGRRTQAEHVAADVLAGLDERPADQPFFLYVHTIDPHVPYRPPAEFVELYADAGYTGPVDFRRDATLLENIKIGRIRLAERDRRHLEALYDGEITYHDVHFRAILEGLERRGLRDETMVVITSDHGEEFWDHGSVGHGHSVYEELLHVPMFVALPGEHSVRRIDMPVGLVDVMPTILEALGVEGPADMSGRSFLGVLRGEDEVAPRGNTSGFMDNWRTYTLGRFKLVMRPGNRAALYDLESDPNEERDISRSRPVTTHWMRGLLGLRQAETSGGRAGPAPHRRRSTPIDDETAAQLRALGYLGN